MGECNAPPLTIMEKIKDTAYISFLKDKACARCGARPVDAHHEAVLPSYTGSQKNHMDYQAIPMCHSCHLGIRHGQGYNAFWGDMKLTPEQVVLKNLTEYQRSIRSSKYDTPEDYEQAEAYLEEIIEYLEERLNAI